MYAIPLCTYLRDRDRVSCRYVDMYLSQISDKYSRHFPCYESSDAYIPYSLMVKVETIMIINRDIGADFAPSCVAFSRIFDTHKVLKFK